jgi:hypothetical protein
MFRALGLTLAILVVLAFVASQPSATAQDLNWRRTTATVDVASEPTIARTATAQKTANSSAKVDSAVQQTTYREPARLPYDPAIRHVHRAEELPTPAAQQSIKSGARHSQVTPNPAATPFDDDFPEAQRGGRPTTRLLEGAQPPSIMRKNVSARQISQPEYLPAPGQVTEELPMTQPEHLEVMPEQMGQYPGEFYDDGHGCGCDQCQSACGDCCDGHYHGHHHGHLFSWLRHTVRTTLVIAAGGCDPCDQGPFGCEPTPDCYWHWTKDLTFDLGVQGMKTPLNRGSAGNFGFHQGVNWGMPFWDEVGMGAQVGFSALQTSIDETTTTVNDRQQYFITGGLYRRQMSGYGWQYGVVYDHLIDNYIDQVTLGQIRGELGYLFAGHEIGFWFAANAKDFRPDSPVLANLTGYETMNISAMYYRMRMYNGGEGRLWIGMNDNSDGMFGGDYRVPLNDGLALQASFNYLSEGETTTTFENEGWNVGFSLVFYPGMTSTQAGRSRYRPLFNVGDNGTMLQRGY